MSDHPAPALSVLQAIGDILAKMCLVIAAVALAIIVVINGVNVGFRYFLGIAFSWAEEAMLFLMILMIFAGAVTAAWQGGHMQLDMLVRRLPPGWQKFCIVLTAILSIALLLLLSASSFQVVSAMYRFGQSSVALEFPMWIPQGCVTAGFILIAFMTGLRLLVVGARLSKSEAEEYVERNT